MELTEEFIVAFNFAMQYEVGAWNPNDPDVIAGKCETKEQKRKVGYVNDPHDRGGETKFGIAKNSNPDCDIISLTLRQAQEIYYEKYWLVGKCDKLKTPLSILHFDNCVNHGPSRAIKFLQKALGVETAGVFGPKTLAAVEAANPFSTADAVLRIREDFFKAIVERDPSQAKFLKGWLNRVASIRNILAKWRQ